MVSEQYVVRELALIARERKSWILFLYCSFRTKMTLTLISTPNIFFKDVSCVESIILSIREIILKLIIYPHLPARSVF